MCWESISGENHNRDKTTRTLQQDKLNIQNYMKRILTTLFIAIATLTSYATPEWLDVTDKYVTNPRFDNNDIKTGWSGTAFTANNPFENAEHFGKNYDTYQTIKGLQPGKYRLSLNAFYRMGDAENDYALYKAGNYKSYQHALLYAKSSTAEKSVAITPASSAALEEPLGGQTYPVSDGGWWWSSYYYLPDDMEAAHYWFEAGKYKNTLECEVGEDGTLTIGIKKNETIDNDWTCLDNWKLEYWGEPTLVTNINLSETTIELVPTEKKTLSFSFLPEDATHKDVTWVSSNTKVATVNLNTGEITAVAVGTCNITARTKDTSGVTASCQVNVVQNPATASSLIINEIMSANVDVYLDPSFNYGSWVELYNPTNKSVSLGGLYVTDDPQNLKKHQLTEKYGALPAKGFALLNFDHHEIYTTLSYRQIPYELNCDGGVIIISDGNKILAQQEYPEAISRTSYARTMDGGEEWGVTGIPSPGASNQDNDGWATTQLAAPIVDKDGQRFSGTLRVSVNIPQGATLRYTTDGTAPTLTNGEISKTGLFDVSYTTCYRFRLFQEGYLPSRVVTRSYIYDGGEYYFPIISIVTDIDNIYDNDRGLFQSGPYGRPGNGQTGKCNWNMDWDRPVSFEYITDKNEYLVSQECNMSMCGGWSRAWNPHSFKLKAKKYYDFENTFQAQFFDEKPYLKNKTLQIRNGGNDNNNRIKDAALQQIVARSGMDVDYQAWQPVHVFFNGSHYAVLNMREPNNKHYAYANYGIDTDEMDQFEICPDSGYIQMKGTDEAFLRLVELSENASDEATYEEICQLMDIDEYINYMAVEFYIGNWDWPQNNVKGFRDVNDGKFRFVLYDLDGAFSTSTPFKTFFDKEKYTFDTLHGYDYSTNKSIEGKRLTKEIKFVTLFKNMLKNDTFRKKFIDTFCIMGGSVYQPSKVSAIINEMREYLSQGWWVSPDGTANDLINKISSTYNNSLTSNLKGTKDMKLTSVIRQVANLSVNVPNAKIRINDIEVPYSEFNGYLFAPITLKAEAPAGYRFKGWMNDGGSTSKQIFGTGGSWKYYDQGSLDGKKWTSTSYTTTNWGSGNAPIGYGKDQKTETAHNLSCYYFRKTFVLANDPQANDEFVLDFTIDDGMIVYVNGTEAGRYNMPAGNASFGTWASSYAPNNPDTGTLTLSASLFQKGTNVIAVEVHNNSETSTDILWDASLSQVSKTIVEEEFASTDAEFELPTTGALKYVAVFEEIPADELAEEGITPVRINEVSAANSMYVNDYFKKDDWIELYNTTDKPIDIKGMYISDKIDNTKKYQVPADDVNLNTVIPAYGYKVIWCQQRDNIGSDIHASFKLASEGGDVVITTATYADTLHYDTHTGVQTFGRYPDGSNDTYVMNHPTIAKANQISSYDTLYVKPIDPNPEDAIRTYTKEGGISIAYVGGSVNVKSEDSPIRSVQLYNTSGMLMGNVQRTRSSERFVSLFTANLPKGVYIITATTEEGDECRIKFFVR